MATPMGPGEEGGRIKNILPVPSNSEEIARAREFLRISFSRAVECFDEGADAMKAEMLQTQIESLGKPDTPELRAIIDSKVSRMREVYVKAAAEVASNTLSGEAWINRAIEHWQDFGEPPPFLGCNT